MKILIAENEIYLAQSIANKLIENGYACDIVASGNDIQKNAVYDVILLSTSMGTANFMPIIERFKRSIIILMVSYINNDTVSAPLKAGATDYMLKPFMIEELIKRVNHYVEYDTLFRENHAMKEYLGALFAKIALPDVPKKMEFPCAVVCPSRLKCDAYAFKLATSKQMCLDFAFLDNGFDEALFDMYDGKSIVYVQGIEGLKKQDRKLFFDAAVGKNVILASAEPLDDEHIYSVVLDAVGEETAGSGSGDILTIEGYVKSVIVAYQDKYPDVELSKKLGISRKSLWEKRKKHGITKKK